MDKGKRLKGDKRVVIQKRVKKSKGCQLSREEERKMSGVNPEGGIYVEGYRGRWVKEAGWLEQWVHLMMGPQEREGGGGESR